MGVETAITIGLSLLDRGMAYFALMQKAKAENRDITDAELATLAAADDAARASLVDAIAARKAREQ